MCRAEARDVFPKEAQGGESAESSEIAQLWKSLIESDRLVYAAKNEMMLDEDDDDGILEENPAEQVAREDQEARDLNARMEEHRSRLRRQLLAQQAQEQR